MKVSKSKRQLRETVGRSGKQTTNSNLNSLLSRQKKAQAWPMSIRMAESHNIIKVDSSGRLWPCAYLVLSKDANTTLTHASVPVSSKRIVPSSTWHEEGATAKRAVSKTRALEISPTCESAEKAGGWVFGRGNIDKPISAYTSCCVQTSCVKKPLLHLV